MKSKTTADFVAMTETELVKALKTTTTRVVNAKDKGQKEIAMQLVAAEEKGLFKEGEMNTFAIKVTGVELRRELQGTYEAVNVLRAIRKGEIDMTEEEFVSKKFGSFSLIRLSSLLSKNPDLVDEALEIIRDGKNVTNGLRALGKKPKSESAESGESEEPKGKSGGSAGKGESLNSDSPPAEAPKGRTFFVPDGMAVLSVPEIKAAILEEIRNAPDEASADAYMATFRDFSAQLASRYETLEAEAAAKDPKPEAVAA